MSSISSTFLEKIQSGQFRSQLQTPVPQVPSGENLQQLKSDLTTSNAICITSPCDGNLTAHFQLEVERITPPFMLHQPQRVFDHECLAGCNYRTNRRSLIPTEFSASLEVTQAYEKMQALRLCHWWHAFIVN